PGLRLDRLRLGDGGLRPLRQAARRPRHRAAARRAPDRPAGVLADPAADPGDELRPAGPADGPGPVLDPPGDGGAGGERAAGVAARRPGLTTPVPGPRVLLVDNDDSYTYNLFHLIGELTGRPPRVVGHDEPVRTADYSHLVISPGPGHPGDPRRAGRAAELIMTADRPVLGVCLGHQLLGLAFRAAVIEVEPHHGLISRVRHDGTGVFRGLPQAFRAVRYHSLAVVDPPAGLEVTARACDDGVIMGLRHRDRELHGVQFHPESIAAESGRELMINFLGPPVRRPVRRSREPRSARPRRAAVLLRELPWRDPEDVFVAHYAARPRVCWLDSSRPGPDARFSYLGEPTDVIGGRYGGGPDTRPDLLDRLAELLARPAPADTAATSDVPFAFRG